MDFVTKLISKFKQKNIVEKTFRVDQNFSIGIEYFEVENKKNFGKPLALEKGSTIKITFTEGNKTLNLECGAFEAQIYYISFVNHYFLGDLVEI